jgi:hypothetical protein
MRNNLIVVVSTTVSITVVFSIEAYYACVLLIAFVKEEPTPADAKRNERICEYVFYAFVIGSAAVITVSLILIARAKVFTEGKLRNKKAKMYFHIVLLMLYVVSSVCLTIFYDDFEVIVVFLTVRAAVDFLIAYVIYTFSKRLPQKL